VPPAVAQLETATADTKVPQAVALLSPEDRGQMRHLVVRLPWGHNILLIEKIKDLKIRVWYMRTTIDPALPTIEEELSISDKGVVGYGG